MATDTPFPVFGAQHLITTSVVAAVLIIIPWLVKRAASQEATRRVALLLAGLILLVKVGEPFLKAQFGDIWQEELPLHMCDFGALAAAFFLLRPNMLLFELSYFWALGGGIQALLTPTLQHGFPHLDYWSYFITHGLGMLGAVYGIVAMQYRPELKSVWRAFVATLCHALLVYPINLLLNSNYLYLSHKPNTPSLMDYLGPWPWYILSLVGVALIVFFLYYSPFLIADIILSRQSGRASGNNTPLQSSSNS